MPKKSLPLIIQQSKPMDYRYVDYEYCQYKVQSLNIDSARSYMKWFRGYAPSGFPAKPDRTYSDVWISWNDFVNGENMYLANHPKAVRKDKILDYWDAVNLIHPLQLKTREEWEQAFDDGLIPPGIPKNPGNRYKVFYPYGGYKTWLGKDIKHRVEAKQQVKTLFILYRRADTSSNVLNVLMYTKGYRQLINDLQGQDMQVLKIYEWESGLSDHVFNVLDHYGTKQGEVSWLFNSIDVILYELGGILNEYCVG